MADLPMVSDALISSAFSQHPTIYPIDITRPSIPCYHLLGLILVRIAVSGVKVRRLSPRMTGWLLLTSTVNNIVGLGIVWMPIVTFVLCMVMDV